MEIVSYAVETVRGTIVKQEPSELAEVGKKVVVVEPTTSDMNSGARMPNFVLPFIWKLFLTLIGRPEIEFYFKS